ncbi:hypothetical protein B6S59_31605 [Pseudomonas sp. A46]|nr:hypothetical protein B6S59_31605 [Pseudomonas sp. A46]
MVVEIICNFAVWQEDKILVTNNGADENDAMVKMARYCYEERGRPGKRRIISCAGAFQRHCPEGAALVGSYG